MKPSTELFDLIKSLSGSEKRYFKLHTSLQQGNKDYLKLFEEIDAQEVYDEKAIKLKFKKDSEVKNITFTKNYLYKLIFKSLNSYNEEKSIDSKLTNILNRCRILLYKALIRQYFKTLKMGKELAVKNERFSYLLEFLEIERQLTKKEELSKNDISKVYIEENDTLDKIRNINEYKRAVNILFKIFRTDGIVRTKNEDEKINQILASVNYPDENKAMSVIAKETYYFALSIANEFKGDFEKAYFYFKKRFQIIDSNTGVFQNSLFNNYKDSFLMMISAASDSGKFTEAENLYKKFIQSFKTSEDQDLDVSFTRFGILLNYVLHTGNKNDFSKHAAKLETYLTKYKDKILINTYCGYFFKLAKFHFITGDYSEALRVINQLFASRHLKYSPFIEPYVRMLNILIHSELGNTKLLNYLISSTSKYLKSRNKLYKTESTVLNYLKKSSQLKNSTPENKTKLLKEFHKTLCKLKKTEFERNAFHYIDYAKWIEKKL